MRKITVISIVAVAVVMLAMSAFGATKIGDAQTNATYTIGGAVFTPSSGVQLSTIAVGTAYCVTATHTQAVGKATGKEYGALSSDPIIQYIMNPTQLDDCGDVITLPSGSWTK